LLNYESEPFSDFLENKKGLKSKTLETPVFIGGEYRSRTGDLLPASPQFNTFN